MSGYIAPVIAEGLAYVAERLRAPDVIEVPAASGKPIPEALQESVELSQEAWVGCPSPGSSRSPLPIPAAIWLPSRPTEEILFVVAERQPKAGSTRSTGHRRWGQGRRLGRRWWNTGNEIDGKYA